MSRLSTASGKTPRRPAGRTGVPWIFTVSGVVAGIALVSIAARVGGDSDGPLRQLAPSATAAWPGQAGQAPAAVAVRLERFAHQSFTRTGARWHVDAAALLTDPQGVVLVQPVLELIRSTTVVARLRAGEARLRPDELGLSLHDGVVLEVGDDLALASESLVLMPDGTVRGEGSVSVTTPQGRARSEGILVEPAEGRVTLFPGTPDQESLRWNGWGQGLVDLGEAVRNWSRSTLRSRRSPALAVVETAGSAAR